MKKGVLNTQAIAEIAIFAAIAFILDFVQERIFDFIPFFANGGSIGFAMIPIILIGLRRGVICGTICGLVTSLCQMLGGVTAINGTDWAWYAVFFQILLDYALAYTLVGLFSGFFYHTLNKDKSTKFNVIMVVLACVCGGFAKFMSHFLAGCIFWQSFEIFNLAVSAPLYSFIYNGLYCFPNIIISAIVLGIIYVNQPRFFYLNYQGKVREA